MTGACVRRWLASIGREDDDYAGESDEEHDERRCDETVGQIMIGEAILSLRALTTKG